MWEEEREITRLILDKDTKQEKYKKTNRKREKVGRRERNIKEGQKKRKSGKKREKYQD